MQIRVHKKFLKELADVPEKAGKRSKILYLRIVLILITFMKYQTLLNSKDIRIIKGYDSETIVQV
jgi:hypothetical protein